MWEEETLPQVCPSSAWPFWPGDLIEQFCNPGEVLSPRLGQMVLTSVPGLLEPFSHQGSGEQQRRKLPAALFLARSLAVGFGYAVTWALFLSRPDCVLLSPELWSLPSDLPFLLATDYWVHVQRWELYRCQEHALWPRISGSSNMTPAPKLYLTTSQLFSVSSSGSSPVQSPLSVVQMRFYPLF